MTVILPKSKTMQKMLKAVREKWHFIYGWKTISIWTYFSSGSMEPGRSDKQHWSKLKEKNLSTSNSIFSENIVYH